MKIKTILFMVLSLMSFTVFAQNNGGVKGKVVSRTTRAAIDGVKVTLTPGDVTTKTDAVSYTHLYINDWRGCLLLSLSFARVLLGLEIR